MKLYHLFICRPSIHPSVLSFFLSLFFLLAFARFPINRLGICQASQLCVHEGESRKRSVNMYGSCVQYNASGSLTHRNITVGNESFNERETVSQFRDDECGL
jgi:hypothetical protein